MNVDRTFSNLGVILNAKEVLLSKRQISYWLMISWFNEDLEPYLSIQVVHEYLFIGNLEGILMICYPRLIFWGEDNKGLTELPESYLEYSVGNNRNCGTEKLSESEIVGSYVNSFSYHFFARSSHNVFSFLHETTAAKKNNWSMK